MSATKASRLPGGVAFAAFALFVTLSAALTTAHAQVITEADIERARRETPGVSEADIAAAARRHALPALPEAPSAPGPALDALPRPAAGKPLDLEAIARGYRADPERGGVPGLSAGPRLLVFVSLNMPQESLKRLLAQAARARASVLLRGLANDSLPATVARVRALGAGSNVQIDPRAFARFGINRIPSFVLADGGPEAPCAGATCPPPADFVKAAGDVSLDYALARLRDASPRHAPAAAVFLKRLAP